jgi:hypothetical protein
MKIPQNWWVGCSGYNLHDGKKDSFDICSKKWNLLLDARDDDDMYLIAYDAVYQSVQDSDEEIGTEEAWYTKTTWEEWNQVSTEDGDGNGNGRTINPIECTVDEDFYVKITDEEVELLKYENGEIRYEKVF